MKKLLPLFAAVFSITAHAAPPPIQSSPFGIDALKPQFGRDLPNIWELEDTLANYVEDAGFRWDRAGINWGDVQRSPDAPFDWSFTDRMAQVYHRRPISAFCLLMGGVPGAGHPPQTDAERAQFAYYVYQVVSRYKGTFRVWEIWNEENIPTFWKAPSHEDYAKLLQAAYAAAHRADPDCIVIMGGSSTVDLGWIKRVLFDDGAWDACDAVAIHPYSMGGGPAAQGLAELVRMTRAAATKDGVSKPVWITEVGFRTDGTDQSELRQADALVQEYTLALAENVRKVFWFTLGDWDEKWGLVAGKKNRPDWGFTSTTRTKPAYYAARHLIEALSPGGTRPHFLGYLPRMGGAAAAFLNDATHPKPVLIVWEPFGVSETLNLGQASGLHARDARDRTLPVVNGRLTVGEVPVIVTGWKDGALKAAAPRFDPSLRQPGKNIVLNPSMETMDGENPAFWNRGRFPNASKDATLTLTPGRTGARSLGISAAKDGAWSSVPLPVWSGKTYALHAWMKPTAATGENRIQLQWYSGNMWTQVGQEESPLVTGDGDWREVTITGVPPRDATFARITLISKNNTGAVSFDDVTLTEG